MSAIRADLTPEMVPDEDFAHVAVANDLAGTGLTAQETRYVTLRCHGFPRYSAARHSGMAPDAALRLEGTERVGRIMAQLREMYQEAVEITRETVTVMLLEAHRKAGTASEEIMAAKELGKLHGLYKSDDQRGAKTINNTQINGDVLVDNRKKITRMTDDQLLQLAQQALPQESPT